MHVCIHAHKQTRVYPRCWRTCCCPALASHHCALLPARPQVFAELGELGVRMDALLQSQLAVHKDVMGMLQVGQARTWCRPRHPRHP